MKRGPELGFDDEGKPVLITAAAPAFSQFLQSAWALTQSARMFTGTDFPRALSPSPENFSIGAGPVLHLTKTKRLNPVP